MVEKVGEQPIVREAEGWADRSENEDYLKGMPRGREDRKL